METKFSHAILIVDDEDSILRALNRLFRKEDYKILTAESGNEGLKLIGEASTPFSLIISDQRMPEMTGDQFLAEARKIAPDSMRVLLTGYAEVDSIIEAVNKGGIHRYFTKPWKDEELLIQVRQLLEQYSLIQENRRLHDLTRRQNEELASLNIGLEEKVREKTAEIVKKNEALIFLNQELETGLFNTVKAFGALTDRFNQTLAGHGRRVSLSARELAQLMGLAENDINHIEIAALLHDIGKLGFPPKLLEYKEDEWSTEERNIFKNHPIYGQETVHFINKLTHVSILIRTHHERYDGLGYPDRLKEEEIPLGAKIIAVADAYDKIVNLHVNLGNAVTAAKASKVGAKYEEALRESAVDYLKRESFQAFDPEIIKHFLTLIKTKKVSIVPERRISILDVKEGMILAKPLYSSSGRFLLPQKSLLTAGIIRKLKLLNQNDPITDEIHIIREKVNHL
jgi:response regulator RpfG family c-di-GMP phosphodiesterase